MGNANSGRQKTVAPENLIQTEAIRIYQPVWIRLREYCRVNDRRIQRVASDLITNGIDKLEGKTL